MSTDFLLISRLYLCTINGDCHAPPVPGSMGIESLNTLIVNARSLCMPVWSDLGGFVAALPSLGSNDTLSRSHLLPFIVPYEAASAVLFLNDRPMQRQSVSCTSRDGDSERFLR